MKKIGLGWVSVVSRASVLLGCRGAIWHRRKALLLASILFSPFMASQCPALAQSNIVPDNTLGSESSNVIFNLGGTPSELITSGAQRGQNLFHSFREFNVSAGRGAYFFIPNASIANVLTRVTGSNRSEILGTLGTIQAVGDNFAPSNANLFIINPNGIIFGENSRLYVGGSFVATTANGIQFGNQGNFSATNAQTPGVLTVKPSALFLNQINQNAAIQNNASLSVPEGRSLLLVGGNVNSNGGILFAPGGRVELGGLTGKGNIEIQQDGNLFSLNFPNQVQRGNLSLNNSAQVNVLSAGGGSIALNFQNIDISGRSQIFAGIAKPSINSETVAGDINLNATEAIKVEQESIIASVVLSGKGGDININAKTFSIFGSLIAARTSGEGNGGNLTINTQDLLMGNGARVSADTFGIGNSGNLNVNAFNSVKVIGVTGNNISSTLASQAVEGSDGNAGTLTINTKDLLVQDGAQISAGTFAAGNGGQLTINATNSVQVLGSSGLFASAEKNSTGNSGDLTITTKRLLLSDDARVSVAMRGVGKAGNLNINAQNLLVNNGGQISAGLFGSGRGGNLIVNAEEVQLIGRSDDGLFGSGLFTSAESGSIGDAGDLVINTQNLLVRDGASIGADALGRGNGGNLTVNASGKVELIGGSDDGSFDSGLFARTGVSTIGNGGVLRINTQNLIVRDGAQVSTSTFGTGKGGDLNINASGKLEVIGRSIDGRVASTLATQSNPDATGNAGNLKINTQNILVQNGAQLSSSTFGTGNGGNLELNATGDVQLIGGGSGLFSQQTNSSGTGNAGNLTITTKNLLVQDGAQVLTVTLGAGNGGNLNVNAFNSIKIIGQNANGRSSSGLFAANGPGATGNAGNLTVDTSVLLIEDGAQISTGSFGAGNGANLTINASDSVQIIGRGKTGLRPSSGLFSTAEQSGNAGNLNINTPILLIRDGGGVSAGSSGSGQGSNLTINASKEVQVINLGALFTQAENTGNAGNLIIHTPVLLIEDGGVVSASSFGKGRAGNVEITADKVELRGVFAENGQVSTVRSFTVGEGSTAKAGDITLKTRILNILDDANISTISRNQGQAGNIDIRADERLIALDGSIFTTSLESSGGSVNITSGDIRLFGDSDISTFVLGGAGGGGDIKITANSILAFNDSDIFAFAQDGKGGNITLNTPAFFGQNYRPATPGTNPLTLDGNNRVDINASGAVSGVIVLPDTTFVQNNLGKLPQTAIDTNTLIANSCIARRNQQQNGSFFITGSGGLPARPGDAPLPSYSTGDVQPIPAESTTLPTQKRPWKIGDPVIEPSGVYELPNGKLVLGKEC